MATLQASLLNLPAFTPLSLEPRQTAVTVLEAMLVPKAQVFRKRWLVYTLLIRRGQSFQFHPQLFLSQVQQFQT